MKKIIFLILIVLVFIGLIYTWREKNKEYIIPKTGPITIGVILPMTGKAANIGEDIKDGIDIAINEINSTEKHIDIIYQDDECDPKKSMSVYQNMHDIKDINVMVGPVCSPCTLAVAPLAEKKQSYNNDAFICCRSHNKCRGLYI